MSQQKQRLEWCNAHFEGEEGTTKQGSQTVSSNWKSQGTESPLDPPDGASSAHTVTLAQWDPQGTSNFQNCKIINVCCFSSYRKTDTDTPVDSSHWPCHSVLFSSSRRRNKLWLTNYGVRPWKSLTHSVSLIYFLKILFIYFDMDLLKMTQVAQMVKNLPAVQKTWVLPLSREDPLEKGKATHSSILAWRIPWMEEPGELQSMDSQRVRHNWVTNTHTF